MRTRKQNGQIVRIGDRWYVRYWDRRNVGGTIERKRVTHPLGPVATRGKNPPADIQSEADRHMASVNNGTISPERVLTLTDFVEKVYLPWIKQHKRPSTYKGYKDVWEDHLKPLCGQQWLKNTRTYIVQQWLTQISKPGNLSRNSLRHIKSVISGIFTLAKQLAYFEGENPARDTAIDPGAAEAEETYAYTLDEVQTILSLLPEPAATAFAVAAFMGLRHGEIQGLLWENYVEGEMHISRSIWNGHVTAPKTRKGRAPVPVIKQLAERLELHRLRCGNPQTGPIFANTMGNPLNMNNLLKRVILPSLNCCLVCQASEDEHAKPTKEFNHKYERDMRIPEWHGWHAARRGLGSNLYRLGVPDIVIQRILRHANVSTTTAYYVKTVAGDIREAMSKLENNIPRASKTPETLWDTNRTLEADPAEAPASLN